MTPERFERLARAYGAALERWPDAVRAEADDLARTMPELKTILAREARVDHALRLAGRPVSDQRGERVCRAVLDRLDRPRAPIAPVPYWERPRALASAALLLLVVALAGFAAGDAGLFRPDPAAGDGFSPFVSSDVILVSWE